MPFSDFLHGHAIRFRGLGATEWFDHVQPFLGKPKLEPWHHHGGCWGWPCGISADPGDGQQLRPVGFAGEICRRRGLVRSRSPGASTLVFGKRNRRLRRESVSSCSRERAPSKPWPSSGSALRFKEPRQPSSPFHAHADGNGPTIHHFPGDGPRCSLAGREFFGGRPPASRHHHRGLKRLAAAPNRWRGCCRVLVHHTGICRDSVSIGCQNSWRRKFLPALLDGARREALQDDGSCRFRGRLHDRLHLFPDC